MSQFDNAIEAAKKQLSGTAKSGGMDENLLIAVAKGLGPSIYNDDSKLVSCSDKEERERVKKNFLIGKLGMEDSDELDAAIEEVCQAMSSERNKLRTVFYYHLVKKFGRESMYA